MNRRRLVDLPLIIKIGFAPAFALVMLAALAIGALALQRDQATELNRVVQVDMPNSLRMQKVSERITAIHGQLYFLLTHQAAGIETAGIDRDSRALMDEVGAIRREVVVAKAAAPADQRKSYDELLVALTNTSDALNVITAMVGVDFSAAAGFAAPFEGEYSKMSAILHRIVEADQARTAEAASASGDRARKAEVIILIAALATLLVAGALAALLTTALRRDVQKIALATEALAEGENDIDLAGLARADELGAIVRSLKIFQDNQRHLETMREQGADQAGQQAAVVEGLAVALGALAAGDLTHRLPADFPVQYLKLRDDFNNAVAKVEEAMRAIAGATSSIQTGADEISNSADDLSHRTERQAATLEETAAALDQITVTVNKTAEGAGLGREATGSAKADAEQSSEIVRQAVIAMKQIQDSAKQISQIIGVVDEIAFQTNLLALNAGVEAARAGDSGRGFAVVATEVRALAQRSAEAAKEIKALISASTDQVAEGVNLVGETGKALGRIVKQVSEIAIVVSEIAASAKEEAIGLGQVNTAVNQMDQVTQQNAAMVEESTAASRALAAEAQELARLVGRFRVTGGSTLQPIQSQPATNAYRPLRTARPLSRGNTALAERPVVEDESWDAF